MPRDCVLLAIETSCDETAAAIVVNGKEVRSNIIASQVVTHRRFGGVVPEIASRRHLEAIVPVVEAALVEAGMHFGDLDGVAVTYGPGLVGALLVGLSYAKSVAYALRRPLIGVNHLLGHIYAAFLEYPHLQLPAVCLVVSGGHTHLIYLEDHVRRRILGSSRDDAAGEAFDKVARAMGLGYPGGPQLERLAAGGDPQALHFPRAWLEEDSLDFSFSGLKTAVLNYLKQSGASGKEGKLANIAAGFQAAVVEVLATKAIRAAWGCGVRTLIAVGGVAANMALRRALVDAAAIEGLRVFFPRPGFCTDNAAMIGCAAYYQYLRRDFAPLSLNAHPNLPLD